MASWVSCAAWRGQVYPWGDLILPPYVIHYREDCRGTGDAGSLLGPYWVAIIVRMADSEAPKAEVEVPKVDPEVKAEEESSSDEDDHAEHSHEHPHDHDHSHDHHHDPDHPHEHPHDHEHPHEEGGAGAKQNRGEKKCRKAMQKLGLKPLTGINRVTIKRSKNIIFVIDTPEVMKSPNSDTYIIFGEAKYEDINQMAASSEATKFKAEAPAVPKEAPIEPIKEEDEGEEGELDESGLNVEDIENVMSHCHVTRRAAVKALRDASGDSISAILSLTK